MVEIARADIEALDGKKSTNNAGGRPPKHDWEQFWREVVVSVYEDGLPDKLDQWVRRLQEKLPSLIAGGDKGPDESQLRKKLQPVFRQLRPTVAKKP